MNNNNELNTNFFNIAFLGNFGKYFIICFGLIGQALTMLLQTTKVNINFYIHILLLTTILSLIISIISILIYRIYNYSKTFKNLKKEYDKINEQLETIITEHDEFKNKIIELQNQNILLKEIIFKTSINFYGLENYKKFNNIINNTKTKGEKYE